jgi:glycosyltransferase involved in cell wall biosynthesis
LAHLQSLRLRLSAGLGVRSTSPRICILTPGHLSTNPRVVKEADALASANYDVKVIAGDFAYWAREADHTFAGRSWSVVRKLAFGPNAPTLVRTRQLIRRHSARAMVSAGLRLPAVVRAACHPIGPDLVAAARRVPADLYIAHYTAAFPAAAIAAHHHGALYAFDAEDFHLGDLPDLPQHSAERDMIYAIERRYIRSCAYVTAASPGIADAYADAYEIERPTVVLNVFPRSQAPRGPTSAGTAIPGPSVYWFSQTVGPDRGLECAARAIGRARSRPHLYLRGTPAHGFVAKLRTIAAEIDAADRIHILPPAAPSEMERLAASYDLGLCGETGRTRNHCIALANKLFSYLLAGLPIVLSDIPAHREFSPRLGDAARLYAAGDADSLASVIDSFVSEPTVLGAARAKAYRLGQTQFNWDIERSILLNRVQDVVREHPRRRD